MITILASGSRGDTQPYVALGLALKKAGQQVRVTAFENYQSFITGYGLDFYPIKGDIEKISQSASVRSAHNADSPLKVLLSFRELQKMVFEVQQDLFDSCQGSDAVIYHPGAAIGYFAAQKLGIPAIFAPPFPMTPTREFPSVLFYGRTPDLAAVNLLTHKVFSRIMWSAAEKPILAFWKRKFGQKPDSFGSPYEKQTTAKNPTIISNSEFVFPRPSDWPSHVFNTGYWFLDEPESWAPSDELLSFLKQGELPVYVGFGSVGSHMAEQLTPIVIEGLRLVGKRGIIATGWGGLTNAHSSPEDYFIQGAPHSWLFQRVQAVVHHGGAGTTAAGLRAGVPSIIIPFSNDQFAWARRVYDLGVGSEPLSVKNLTARKLADAISAATLSQTIEKARNLGKKIDGEDGANNAAKVVLRALE
jgi:sterol 3beta-glucosyltransferase